MACVTGHEQWKALAEFESHYHIPQTWVMRNVEKKFSATSVFNINAHTLAALSKGPVTSFLLEVRLWQYGSMIRLGHI